MATPTQLLKRLGAEYPDAWALAESMHRDRGTFATWPKWCFLPFAGWYAILSTHFQCDPPLSLSQLIDISALAAVGPWRYSKGIYRFAPEIFEAVYASPPKGDIPIDALKRLPEWCVYIETPASLQGRYRWLDRDLTGFFAHLEKDADTGQEELRFLILSAGGLDCPCIIHLGPYTISEGVFQAVSHAREASIRERGQDLLEGVANEEIVEQHLAETFGLVALTLYLCSDGADIAGPALPASKSGRAKLKKGRAALAEAPKVTIYQVGEGLARKIREAEAQERGPAGERAAPRPHLRRGHWHSFWTGPRQPKDGEERKTIVRFVMPMLVGG